MPLDRTAFFTGTYSDAELRNQGDNMSLKERFAWVNKTVKSAFDYLLDKPLKLDRTTFSTRKHLL